jgi:hypothetical protein
MDADRLVTAGFSADALPTTTASGAGGGGGGGGGGIDLVLMVIVVIGLARIRSQSYPSQVRVPVYADRGTSGTPKPYREMRAC